MRDAHQAEAWRRADGGCFGSYWSWGGREQPDGDGLQVSDLGSAEMEKEEQLGRWRVEIRMSLPPANKHMSVLDSKLGCLQKSHMETLLQNCLGLHDPTLSR